MNRKSANFLHRRTQTHATRLNNWVRVIEFPPWIDVFLSCLCVVLVFFSFLQRSQRVTTITFPEVLLARKSAPRENSISQQQAKQKKQKQATLGVVIRYVLSGQTHTVTHTHDTIICPFAGKGVCVCVFFPWRKEEKVKLTPSGILEAANETRDWLKRHLFWWFRMDVFYFSSKEAWNFWEG